jgi:hypothetical protein
VITYGDWRSQKRVRRDFLCLRLSANMRDSAELNDPTIDARSPPTAGLAFSGQCPGEKEQPVTYRRVLNGVEGADEFQGFRSSKRVVLYGLRCWLGNIDRNRWRSHRVGVVEEERHRHIKHPA